jgi:uncharacterized protein YjbI with pentapeptide repeats
VRFDHFNGWTYRMASLLENEKAVKSLLGGAPVWNSWQEANPLHIYDFSGIEFSSKCALEGYVFIARTIFDDAKFSDGSSSHQSQFQKGVSFRNANFGDQISFNRCRFQGHTSFDEATFHGRSYFYGIEAIAFEFFARGCNYLGIVNFDGARIDDADFTNSTFQKRARFIDATFEQVDFAHANFRAEAFFSNSRFAFAAKFEHARFMRRTEFAGAHFDGQAIFDRAEFADDVSFFASKLANGRFRSVRFSGSADFSGASQAPLGLVDFSASQFDSDSKFDNREFMQSTNFSDVIFARPPSFHNSKLHQDTSFDGTDFVSRTGSEAERCFRTLKLAMSQHEAHREELKFFGYEREAKKSHEPPTKRVLYSLYEILSNYGQSVRRPLIAPALTVVIGLGVYAGLSAIYIFSTCEVASGCRVVGDFGQLGKLVWYSLSISFPFFRDSLASYDDVLPKQGLLTLVVRMVSFVQSLFSLVLLFLIGLGLRNLFRLK